MTCLAELHAHSRFSDGRPTPEEIVIRAAQLGLAAVAISDHNTFRGSADGIRALRDLELEINVIPADEVRTSRGDVLVICPSLPEEDPRPGIEPPELADWARERGCVTVAAHPFQPGRKSVGLYLLRHPEDFDAVEVWNPRGLPFMNLPAERFARSRGMPMTSGSDAHVLSELGEAPTKVLTGDCSPEGVAGGILKGLTRPTRGLMSMAAVKDALAWSLARRLGRG